MNLTSIVAALTYFRLLYLRFIVPKKSTTRFEELSKLSKRADLEVNVELLSQAGQPNKIAAFKEAEPKVPLFVPSVNIGRKARNLLISV